MIKYIKIIFVIFFSLFLGACDNKDCVEADDWGYPKVYVPSEDYKYPAVHGDLDYQVVDPMDSGQVIIDAENTPIIMSISKDDQWTSWFGGLKSAQAQGISVSSNWDPAKQVPDMSCQYRTNGGASDPRPSVLKARHDDCNAIDNPDMYTDCMVPCYLRNGMGLYVGLSPENGSAEQVAVTRHIPDAVNLDVPYDKNKTEEENRVAQGRDGYLIKGLPKDELPGSMTNDRLFFKIVDKYYGDNFGGYKVRIKEGTRDPKPGVLETIIDAFVKPINGVMVRVYNGIVKNQEYINIVRALLAMYIAFYGLAYGIGIMKTSSGDFTVRAIKVAIVIQLIGPDSWNFFYTYFFSAFIDGVNGVLGLVMSPFPGFDPSDPWYSLDQVLVRFFSAETNAKISSMIFSNVLGVIYFIALYIAVLIFIIAMGWALGIYLVAITLISILVMMAPIFVIFMLFDKDIMGVFGDKLNDLYDEWVNHLMSYAVQLLILFAGIGMFSNMIMYFMERTIGYNVCWNTWSSLTVVGIDVFNFKFWMPDISSVQGWIWMDANGDGIREASEGAVRYIDMPYLDPESDKVLINRMLNNKNFIGIMDVFIFVVSVFLMWYFMKFVPVLSEALKTGDKKQSTGSIFGGGFLAEPGAFFNKGRNFMFGGNPFTETDDKGKKISRADKFKRSGIYGIAKNIGGVGKAYTTEKFREGLSERANQGLGALRSSLKFGGSGTTATGGSSAPSSTSNAFSGSTKLSNLGVVNKPPVVPPKPDYLKAPKIGSGGVAGTPRAGVTPPPKPDYLKGAPVGSSVDDARKAAEAARDAYDTRPTDTYKSVDDSDSAMRAKFAEEARIAAEGRYVEAMKAREERMRQERAEEERLRKELEQRRMDEEKRIDELRKKDATAAVQAQLGGMQLEQASLQSRLNGLTSKKSQVQNIINALKAKGSPATIYENELAGIESDISGATAAVAAKSAEIESFKGSNKI